MPRCLPALAVLLLSACSSARQDGIDPKGQAFDAVAPDETVTLTGTEPFWAVTVAGERARYSNPDHPEGFDFTVSRFAGNNGLGFSGTLFEEPFTATLTPGDCSDGMSDRNYPFVATIALGGETLQGCGYTDRQPYTGAPAP
ncbi:MAG: hypothetical protein ACK4IC_11480 [Erythrobacter sp.]